MGGCAVLVVGLIIFIGVLVLILGGLHREGRDALRRQREHACYPRPNLTVVKPSIAAQIIYDWAEDE